MTGPAPATPAPDPRVVAVFGVVAWIAAVVAAFGVLSLALDLDVVREGDAGPLLGPIMVLAGALMLGLALVRVQRGRQAAATAFIGLTAGVYLVMIVAGGIAYAIVSGDVTQLLFFPLEYCTSPFFVAAGVLAGLVGLGVIATVSQAETGGRPRWPWEDRREP